MDFYQNRYGAIEYAPSIDHFTLMYLGPKLNLGMVTKKSFAEGEIVAQVCGDLVHEVRQYSIQLSPGYYLDDPYFCGYFLHSCEPNVMFDTTNCRIVALKKIDAYEVLTLDYAATEDVLYKNFECECGTKSCRGFITGRRDNGNHATG